MKPQYFIKKTQKKIKGIIKESLQEKSARETALKYNINGYKRIYLVHIRKTGGTSLNNMLLSLSGENSEDIYDELVKSSDHRYISNGLIYVGWNKRIICKGTYFYGFSHLPLHVLKLPEKTYTVSCFRDPAKRVISHYNMLKEYQINQAHNSLMAKEGQWLGNSFEDFLKNIPKMHLLNQLYMFSKNYDIDEAVKNVDTLSHYFFLDEFDAGICKMNIETGLNLKPLHIRKSNFKDDISSKSLKLLGRMLRDEYTFIDRIKELKQYTQ